jgi:hypothetical protein
MATAMPAVTNVVDPFALADPFRSASKATWLNGVYPSPLGIWGARMGFPCCAGRTGAAGKTHANLTKRNSYLPMLRCVIQFATNTPKFAI